MARPAPIEVDVIVEMPRCRDCTWWGSLPKRELVADDRYGTQAAMHAGAGSCRRINAVYGQPDTDPGAWAEDWDGFVSVMVTRPDFGCIKFEAKP